MEAHEAAVAAVSARIQQFDATKTPFRVYHGSTNSTRKSQRREDNTVDTSRMNHVLNVDTTKKTVLVEPNVPMDELVDATLEHGLVPLVVMEFPGITVGGGFSGTSGESSSFRYGAFETTVNWIEIVLASGEVTRASKTEKPDLFWGAASAFGTLGVVTLLEVQLRDAARYVELTYRHVKGFDEVVSVIKSETADDTPNDYVDGIAFSLNSTIICTGRLVDKLPAGASPRQFLRARDPWFYVHAQRVEKRLRHQPPNAVEVDHIPLTDYLFRYDRGGFWTARYAFRYFLTPFNRITRFLLNPFMHGRRPCYPRACHQSGPLPDFPTSSEDVGHPLTPAPAGLHPPPRTSTFPLLPALALPAGASTGPTPELPAPACTPRFGPAPTHPPPTPIRNPQPKINTPQKHSSTFGILGPRPPPRRHLHPLTDPNPHRRASVAANRLLEQTVHALGGKKWLYGQAFYTEGEF
ncbi:hypothetical protein CHGG_01855 [Chaetomium globosum CBS 148.51]|uniref:Delta(24)-sterol reductase n=1 Tax=Chaetomium globosum (strain ATCC 6205 / CBS 148.51 / DSM 1962 / NBRC 6347 / NRRL 1970) TaxID=306901 RepID=Q2HD49_CHAGB|nr:uncharacterized protein CHGG_01855 [Chaetomium globosum CBS 148.51]EAQ93620.1 hypothetical protein CHGG_01855 [Chaetomium globosum CBS 148.51]